MNEIESLAEGANVEQTTPPVHAKNRVTPLEGFLRFVVVGAGMILGAILALIIGFATGWIAIRC